MHLTFPDGASTTLYLDPKTWLIRRRRDVRPFHPDMDPTPTTIETKMTDFRKVDNLVFSFASTDTDLKTGKILEKVMLREITLNPPVPQDFFGALKEIESGRLRGSASEIAAMPR